MHTSLETTDIFRGAFFMCVGGDFAGIRFGSRKVASFMFKGKDLNKHDKAYINGHALVNPLHFREALNYLRDLLFEQIRNKKHKGEMRYDRKRKNREDQK